jgi:hypothetical protein
VKTGESASSGGPEAITASVGADDAVQQDVADDRGSRWAGIRYCLLVFLGIRIGLTVLAVAAMGTIPHTLTPVDPDGWPSPAYTGSTLHIAATAFERADGLWFLRIADGGYRADDGSAAFFPLYPLAIRGVSWLAGGHPLFAAFLVSNLAFLGALIVLYRLVEREHSTRVARTSVLLVALFPTAFFFIAPLSESLFLLLAVSSFAAARSRRWVLAGLLGALAAGTRIVGIVMVAALAAEAVHQFMEGRRGDVPNRSRTGDATDGPPTADGYGVRPGDGTPRRLAVALACSLMPILAFVSYGAYWAAKNGDWLAPLHAEERWMRVRVLPWEAVGRATQQAFDSPGNYPTGYQFVDWLVVVPCLIAAVYVVWRFRPGYAVYTWGGLLAPLSFIFLPRAFMSDPRFVLPLFPIFVAGAVLIERGKIPRMAVLGACAVGLGLLTSLFVSGYYIF